ncbi:MAG: hypothetical protein HeimC3_22860 [Candidatus Heimdallarchaeota archaeon LC_3]|nr:MAG: hypothetical protein HeimC3_22860 [Candidatus Heimdallarchaeota archaeon LC_3]
MALRLLIAGAFFDVLDGKFARRAPIKSELGVYADSFADLFTFALLPSYMALNADLFLGDIVVVSDITLIMLLAGLYSFAGWFRLVRFSQQPTGIMFEGLPSSAAAMFLGTMILLTIQNSTIEILNMITTGVLVFVSMMMVSKINYPSPKRMWKADNYLFASASAIGFIFIIIPNFLSLFIILIIFMMYIFLGPIYYVKSEEIIAEGIAES